MSNRVIVKLGFIAIIFVFASCTSNVPELPSPGEVKDYKFCSYYDKDGNLQCISNYKISVEQCNRIDGELCSEASCSPATCKKFEE